MEIKKIKIVKAGVLVEFSERKSDGTIKKVSEEHETTPHPDLFQSFANLRAHFAILTGYLPAKAIKKIETPAEDLVDTFTVHGLSIKTGDDEGVVITGQKTLDNGKKVTVNTPFTRFGEGDESAYKFIEDLVDKVERAEVEISAYLDGSKKADDPQGKLFEDKPVNRIQNTDTEDAQLVDDGEIWENGQRPK